MANPDGEIDQQLAADMELRAVARLKEDWAPQLEKECQSYDAQIAELWKQIQNHVLRFKQRKATIFATLAKVEGETRAKEVFRSGLADMMPAKYREIIQGALKDDQDLGNYITPVTSPRTPTAEENARKASTAGRSSPDLSSAAGDRTTISVAAAEALPPRPLGPPPARSALYVRLFNTVP